MQLFWKDLAQNNQRNVKLKSALKFFWKLENETLAIIFQHMNERINTGI